MEAVEAERRANAVIHRMSVVGFPQQEEFEELHERHRFFRVYMVGRAGPAGGGPRLAHALLAFFPYGLVANAFDRIEEGDTVERVRTAHVDACAAAGDRLYGDTPDAEELADRLDALVDAADFAGRPLAGAWADLATPPGVGARLERSATILREHRGNAHVSILMAHGLFGPDPLLLTALWREHSEIEGSARFFGWRDDDIAASWDRLESTGRVAADRDLTDRGREERDAIEELTSALAAERWTGLSEQDRARTVELLEGVSPAR